MDIDKLFATAIELQREAMKRKKEAIGKMPADALDTVSSKIGISEHDWIINGTKTTN